MEPMSGYGLLKKIRIDGVLPEIRFMRMNTACRQPPNSNGLLIGQRAAKCHRPGMSLKLPFCHHSNNG